MDYELYEHPTRNFVGWLRNQGAMLPGAKFRWSGKDWETSDGPRIQATFGNPGLAIDFVQETTER